MWLGSDQKGTLGAGMSPAFLQLLMQQGGMNAPAVPATPAMPAGSFEQQLMQHGGYTTPPVSPSQSPFIQQHPGINPALAGILNNLPPRPTGLPPGILSGAMGGVVDTPIDWNAKASPVAQAIQTVLRADNRSGRRGDTGGGGRTGWGGPEGSGRSNDRNAGAADADRASRSRDATADRRGM